MAPGRCPGPTTRREFMRIGALAVGGLSLSELLAARAASGQRHHDTAVILLYLHGGASQLETYDLKPEAPSSYRSVFKPIRTMVPGMDICELFPRQAELADKLSIVRSLHHDVNIHSDGGIVVLTGKRPSKLDPTSNSKSEHPDFGSVVSKVRGMNAHAIPPYVTIPSQFYMTRPTYLGIHHGPFAAGNPSRDNWSLPQLTLNAGQDGLNLENRRGLLQNLDRLRSDLDPSRNLAGIDKFRDLAFRMLTSPQAAEAFDISQEKETLRDHYGRHVWGQGCLLARRLAEAGVGVISLYVNTPKQGQEFTNWDDHPGNAGRPGHFGKFMRIRLPYLDQAIAALIRDIYERGLDGKIMVVAMGEFGRTPRLRIGPPGDSCGRDHWPDAYSALVSGGGLRMGQVVGVTSSKAEFPTERPYSPQDMLATVYAHLGIDTERAFVDFSGRPVPILGEGAPIRELL